MSTSSQVPDSPRASDRKRRREHSYNGRNNSTLKKEEFEEFSALLFEELKSLKAQTDTNAGFLCSFANALQSVQPLIKEVQSLREEVKELREAGLSYQRSSFGERADPQECIIRYILATEADNTRIAEENLSNSEILKILHALGGNFSAITNVKYVQPKVANGNSGRLPCLLFSVTDWESEKAIRTTAAQIGRALGFSTACYPLKQRYTVHVRDIDQHQHWGNKRDLKTVARELVLPAEVDAKVSFHRLLLTTHDLPTAIDLCRKPMKIMGTNYDVVSRAVKQPGVAVALEGTPLVLVLPTLSSAATAGNSTRPGDPNCIHPKSQKEHLDSARHRQTGPEWGGLVHNPPPVKKTVTTQQSTTESNTSLPSPSSSQESVKKPVGRPRKVPSPSSSQESVKKPVGRPRKVPTDVGPTQRTMDSYAKRLPPSTSIETTPTPDTAMSGVSTTKELNATSDPVEADTVMTDATSNGQAQTSQSSTATIADGELAQKVDEKKKKKKYYRKLDNDKIKSQTANTQKGNNQNNAARRKANSNK
ncbi:hypothetical protein ACHAP5_010761 [Fusarium lateritium]